MASSSFNNEFISRPGSGCLCPASHEEHHEKMGNLLSTPPNLQEFTMQDMKQKLSEIFEEDDECILLELMHFLGFALNHTSIQMRSGEIGMDEVADFLHYVDQDILQLLSPLQCISDIDGEFNTNCPILIQTNSLIHGVLEVLKQGFNFAPSTFDHHVQNIESGCFNYPTYATITLLQNIHTLLSKILSKRMAEYVDDTGSRVFAVHSQDDDFLIEFAMNGRETGVLMNKITDPEAENSYSSTFSGYNGSLCDVQSAAYNQVNIFCLFQLFHFKRYPIKK